MGTLNITHQGNGLFSGSISVVYSPPFIAPPKNSSLSIFANSKLAAGFGPSSVSFTNSDSPAQIAFNFTNKRMYYLQDPFNPCAWTNVTYTIKADYFGYVKDIDSGTVNISGQPAPGCEEDEGGDDGPTTPGSPTTPGEPVGETPDQPVAPTTVCLPTAYVAPAPTVATPCSG